jgi:acyl dehydratase
VCLRLLLLLVHTISLASHLEMQAPPTWQLLANLSVPGNAGRAYGALSGDRNPIHLSALTSQLFGFKRPIAHAMYLVARLEGELANAGAAGLINVRKV